MNLLFLVTGVIPPYLICALLVVSVFHACNILLNLYHPVKESPLHLQRRDRNLRSLSKLTSYFKPRCSNLKAQSLNCSTTLPPFGMSQSCHWVLANFSCINEYLAELALEPGCERTRVVRFNLGCCCSRLIQFRVYRPICFP